MQDMREAQKLSTDLDGTRTTGLPREPEYDNHFYLNRAKLHICNNKKNTHTGTQLYKPLLEGATVTQTLEIGN